MSGDTNSGIAGKVSSCGGGIADKQGRRQHFPKCNCCDLSFDFVTVVPVEIGVIDWQLPVLGGAKLIEVLRDQENAPRLVIYGDDTPDLPRLAMTAGAAGFAPRSGDIEVLLSTCIQVAAGKMVFPFLDIRDLQNDPIQQLSRRERMILEALSKGMTNRELSTECGISINTVKFHLSNLFDKLSVRNRTQAIAFYYSSRLSNGAGGSSKF